MAKLLLSDAVLTSFVVAIVGMGWPSLALQVQKQTEVEVGELLTDQSQGTLTTETQWVFADIEESCNSACTKLCATATCDKLARKDIVSKEIFDEILNEIVDNQCTAEVFWFGDKQGPFATNGHCSYKGTGAGYDDGGASEECDFVSDPALGRRNLCACEILLGSCKIQEDPHIEVFDGSQISLLLEAEAINEEAGEKWIVNSASVKVQARFEDMGDTQLHDQNLFTRAIAIGGDILNGNVMVVGSLEDLITWNGKPILSEQHSRFYFKDSNCFVNATRGSSSLVQDLSQESLGVNVRLRSGVSLVVNRLDRHLNVAIQMPQQAGGQEGLCGNFNGLSTDDTLEMTNRRSNLNVVPDESLFAGISFD